LSTPITGTLWLVGKIGSCEENSHGFGVTPLTSEWPNDEYVGSADGASDARATSAVAGSGKTTEDGRQLEWDDAPAKMQRENP